MVLERILRILKHGDGAFLGTTIDS